MNLDKKHVENHWFKGICGRAKLLGAQTLTVGFPGASGYHDGSYRETTPNCSHFGQLTRSPHVAAVVFSQHQSAKRQQKCATCLQLPFLEVCDI